MALYEYAAKLVDFHDADTVWLDVDQGFYHHQILEIRLDGIDALDPPEEAASQEVARWFSTKPVVRLRTIKVAGRTRRGDHDKQEKYGRWLGIVEPFEGGESLNDRLIRLGFAKPYDGGKRG